LFTNQRIELLKVIEQNFEKPPRTLRQFINFNNLFLLIKINLSKLDSKNSTELEQSFNFKKQLQKTKILIKW
jgi:hypothetical protein